MTWYRQAVHVARKDVRFTRWFIGAYALSIVVAVLSSVSWGPGWGVSFQATMAVLALGLVIVVVAIQADSPATHDAFWLSRPLRPSAVMASKLLLAAGLVVGLGLVGQAAALAGHAVPAASMPPLLLESAGGYIRLVVIAAGLAALTSDLKSFVMAGALLQLAAIFAAPLRMALLGDPSASTAAWAVAALSAGWLGLVVHQYLTRKVRRGRWLAAGLVLASLFLPGSTTGPGTVERRPVASDVPEGLKPGTLRIAAVDLRPGRELQVRLEAAWLRPGHRFAVVSPVVHLLRPDAPPIRLNDPTHPVEFVNGQRPGLTGGDPLRWLNGGTVHLRSRGSLQVELTQEQRAMLAEEGARLRLEGRFTVLEPRVRASIPVQEGATSVREGRRARIADVELGTQGPRVRLYTSTVALDGLRPIEMIGRGRDGGAALYALINKVRNEGFLLNQGSGSSNTLALVVPGPETWHGEMELEPPPFVEPDLIPGAEWLEDAELVLAEWVPLGGYRVALEAPVVEERPGAEL